VLSNGQADLKGTATARFSPFREYTIRAYDADLLTVDIDFVLHDEGIGGP
jgi:NADPH-dependent ferric siderophore reductase